MLVTGGGRGIGRATVLAAARNGYDVCLNFRADEAAALSTLGEAQALGAKGVVVQGDVASEADVVRVFESADRLGRLAVLVNNAGVLPRTGAVADTDATHLTRLFAVNVVGSFLCAQQAILRMSTKRGGSGGSIVNVSSVTAVLGGAGRSVDYGSTKAAIESFTLGLGRELAGEGIRVNAVRPGPVATDFFANSDPGRLAVVASLVPMGRVGTPDEIAAAILWLASDAASFVTGSTLPVTGGR